MLRFLFVIPLTVTCLIAFISGFLTGHQARKFIFDFLRTLVIDSFNQSNNSKASVIIDLVIDVRYLFFLLEEVGCFS